jgi:hypothetical protein
MCLVLVASAVLACASSPPPEEEKGTTAQRDSTGDDDDDDTASGGDDLCPRDMVVQCRGYGLDCIPRDGQYICVNMTGVGPSSVDD